MPTTLDDYEVVGTIGSGTYGTCKKIRRKSDGKILVWKEMGYGTMTEPEKKMLVSEVNLLRELRHQHIVRYYDRIIDRSNTTLYIIMEFCEGGDLASLISKYKREGRHAEEDFVWRICHQLALALKECHCRQKNGKTVLHRDLKPANVFLDENHFVKLGDFGLARVLCNETSFAATFVGTPYYMSPEQMNGKFYNEKSDMWSLGCILYELCMLRPPFTASSQKELASKIITGIFYRIPSRYSEQLNDLIKSMLTVSEGERLTIDQLLHHPRLIHSRDSSEGRSSCGSSRSEDEGYESHKELLKRREEAVKSLERKLLLKQRELEAREKNIILKEKLVEERMKRVESMAKEHGDRVKSLISLKAEPGIAGRVTGNLEFRPTSILLREKKNEETPKKHVSFTLQEKENDVMFNPINGDLFNLKSEKKLESGNTNYMDDLRVRLAKAKIKSDELRTVGKRAGLYGNNEYLALR